MLLSFSGSQKHLEGWAESLPFGMGRKLLTAGLSFTRRDTLIPTQSTSSKISPLRRSWKKRREVLRLTQAWIQVPTACGTNLLPARMECKQRAISDAQ